VTKVTNSDVSTKCTAELKGRADGLLADYDISHSSTTLEEAISIYEEVLLLTPLGHETRAEAFD
jgi:hypothetical protein